ncbi:MAG TPA: hypothetical protein VJU34_13750 [Phenylobacterium sp.]|nr:hypothetical protein [Phenylobacterium sp.]
MPQDEDPLLRDTLFALERLMNMFALERILYLLCAFVSFALLILCSWMLFRTGEMGLPQFAGIFGASGLIAVSAARVSYFLNKSFDLIVSIINRMVALKGAPGDGP